MHRPWHTVGILAFTQIASWGSLYYAFSILAPSIGHDLALRQELVYGAFSWSLLVAGLVAAPTGMMLDRFGGQWVMAMGSAVCSVGLNCSFNQLVTAEFEYFYTNPGRPSV